MQATGRIAAAVIAAAMCVAAADKLAPTPPMGWNSWDAYGTTVREDEVKANAEFMAKRLKIHGWQYVVVDIQWSDPNAQAHGYRPNAELAMDEYGRLIPAANRFPSSANGQGFKPLASAVHAMGLKFGIHIMRGIPRLAVKANTPVLGTKVRAADIANVQSVCKWNTDMYGVDVTKPGGQEYYDSIVRMYADWGVDFIKADDMAAPTAHADEIAALHRAIVKSGRPMVLSLSPGPARVEDAKMLAENAQMWRVSDDLWDIWKPVRHAFDLLARWTDVARPGAWPDGDMLPLGRIGLRAERGDARNSRLTPGEQRTVMTLWAIARSPLIFGGDLPTTDSATIALLTNDEVIAVDQTAVKSRQLFSGENEIAWASEDPKSGAKYLAVFNVGEAPADVRVEWSSLGVPETARVRDLWSHADLGAVAKGRAFALPAHGSGLYKLTAK